MEQKERIEQKSRELHEVFCNLSEDQMKVAGDLIDQAAFMSVVLEDLNESISENGTIESYTNGRNQGGKKISSDAKLYSSLISKYSAVVVKLLKLAPDGRNAKYRTPEDTIRELEEKRAAEEEQDRAYERLKRMDEAFLDAIHAGETDYTHYTDFCDNYTEDEEELEEDE